jgi:protein-disulfide isomerase
MTFLALLRRLPILLALLIGLGIGAPALAQVGRISEAGKARILARPAAPFAGAAAADLTVVEYLDFNCPYCKKAAVTLQQLMAADAKIRVLYKDWPIFGGVSDFAARATLAAGYQGRYLAAHDILIDSPTRLAAEAQVRQRLAFAGVDLEQLDKDLSAHAEAIDAILARNNLEAQALGFTGTPGMVVGDIVVPGALPLETLREIAKASRALDKAAAQP